VRFYPVPWLTCAWQSFTAGVIIMLVRWTLGRPGLVYGPIYIPCHFVFIAALHLFGYRKGRR